MAILTSCYHHEEADTCILYYLTDAAAALLPINVSASEHMTEKEIQWWQTLSCGIVLGRFKVGSIFLIYLSSSVVCPLAKTL